MISRMKTNMNNNTVKIMNDDMAIFQPNDKITIIDNHIYFYTDVDKDSVLKLTNELTKIAKMNLSYAAAANKNIVDEIFLHLHSPGGSLFAGFIAYDYISEIVKKVPIVTIAEGEVASAASLMLVAGNKRYMTPNSFVLIHELRSWAFGPYSKIAEEYENLTKLQNKIKNIYLSKTTIPEEDLDKLLKKDIQLDSNECFNYGIIDEIKTIYL